MTREVTKTVFKFDELSDSAKENARDWYRNGLEFDPDSVYDMAIVAGRIIGVEIDRRGQETTRPAIYWSGFSSQGDGACFVGSYSYKAGSVAAIKAEFPNDTELHKIATELAQIQRRYFYGISASVTHTGRYSHEYSTSIHVSLRNDDYAPEDVAETVSELLRDFMRWIYRSLEKEDEYQRSDEVVDDMIRVNEYEFDESGEIFI